MEWSKVYASGKYSLIDVREPFEFSMGHAEGAENLPLGQVSTQVARLEAMPKPLLMYCRSGGRSGQAVAYLQAQGVTEVYNAGSLEEVMFHQAEAIA